MFLWPDAAACPDVNEPPLPKKSPTEDNSSPCVPASPQSSCWMLRGGLVSIPTLTCGKFPLSHPKSCVLNMAGLRIEVSRLDLGTGTTAVDKPAFRRAGCSLGVQLVKWQDGRSRNISKQISLGTIPLLWAQPGGWESWGCEMLQQCGVRVWSRYCMAGRAAEGLQGFREAPA